MFSNYGKLRLKKKKKPAVEVEEPTTAVTAKAIAAGTAGTGIMAMTTSASGTNYLPYILGGVGILLLGGIAYWKFKD